MVMYNRTMPIMIGHFYVIYIFYIFREEALLLYNLFLLSFNFEYMIYSFLWFIYLYRDILIWDSSLNIIESNHLLTATQSYYNLLTMLSWGYLVNSSSKLLAISLILKNKDYCLVFLYLLFCYKDRLVWLYIGLICFPFLKYF